MNNVIDFTGGTSLDIKPDEVLQNAKETFEQVVVIGIDEDGVVIVRSSTGDIALVGWWMQKGLAHLIKIDKD